MTFVAAIKSAFAKYANFNGRATRPEYWWFFLFVILVSATLRVLSGPEDEPVLLFLALDTAFSIAVLVPALAVAARRLHDTNQSGWNQLWALTIIGVIPLIFWLAQPSMIGPNRFGPAVEADETDLS